MRFPIIELDIDRYRSTIKQMLNDTECHIFIDTNVLSQLFKLNGNARQDFYNWVDTCGSRFHIPNWVVMEYSKRVYSGQLGDYLSELADAKKVGETIGRIEKFVCGYVDDAELVGTIYKDNKDGLLDDMKDIKDKFAKIIKAVVDKKNDHIKKVQKEIDDHLKDKVMDTDIYTIVSNLNFDYELRLDGKIPPGFKDKDKPDNSLGDLIIWNEILEYCKAKSFRKAVFITRDGKPDMYYMPQIRTVSGHPSRDEQKVAHESLVDEFKLKTNGSEDCYLIDFYTLVKMLSDRYRDLAFSFQLVSRDDLQAQQQVHTMASEAIEVTMENREQETSVPPVEEQVEQVAQPQVQQDSGPYSQYALSDSNYMEHCSNDDIKLCIERLFSYNWYIQNDGIDLLRSLVKRTWAETQDNKDAFFVIGRNVLQSADGEAFEACKFIDNMSKVLSGKPEFLTRAIIDGCLYEVFFNSKGKIRRNGFKSRYLQNVVNETQKLEHELSNPFDFINESLERIQDVFVPRVGGRGEYTVEFTFDKSSNDLDHYHTKSIRINNHDVSGSFSHEKEIIFAKKNELQKKLSEHFAIPKELVTVNDVPDDLETVYWIKSDENEILGL